MHITPRDVPAIRVITASSRPPMAGDLLSIAPGGLASVSHGSGCYTQCQVSELKTVRAEDADRLREIGEAAWAGTAWAPAPSRDALDAALAKGVGHRAFRRFKIRHALVQAGLIDDEGVIR